MQKLFVVLLLLIALPLLADEVRYPPPFNSVMYARHDGAFYDQQASEWEATALGDCSEDEAWFQYYKTAQYSNRFGSGKYDLAGIVAQADQHLSVESFVYNYLHFVDSKDPATRSAYLLKAYAADPANHEAYTGLAAYYEANGQVAERNAMVLRKHRAKPIPSAVMAYNYNQLMSVSENGLLLTHGDSDTYPSWILQAGYNVRPDVRVVSLPLLLGFPGFRSGFLTEIGLEDPFAGNAGPPSVAGLLDYLTTQSRPVFFAATGEQHLGQLPKERLFLTGLALQYSRQPVENISLLAGNFSQRWRMEQLRQPLADGPAQAVADQLNQNYLPALLELHELQQREPGRSFTELLPLLQSIAARAGASEELATYLRGGDSPQLASNAPGLRAKDIFKGLEFIPGGTYFPAKDSSAENQSETINGFFLQATEVSNADYQLFLEDLLRQRRFDLLDSVAVAPLDMEALKESFPESENFESLASHLVGNHPAFANYPLVNISHRAAELYATWLAQVYNQDPKRSDGRNVRFRLPEEAEFAYAARGGRKNAPYPWGGPYYRNAKGCLLANFNTLSAASRAEFQQWKEKIQQSTELTAKEKADILEKKDTDLSCDWENDGGYLTVAVASYFPNDYGLYNIAGNAAEMLAEKGKTMGGSWLDAAYFMQIGVVKERTLPHPSTGFRLVMEYID